MGPSGLGAHVMATIAITSRLAAARTHMADDTCVILCARVCVLRRARACVFVCV